MEKSTDRAWAKARGYERYLASSINGEAAINWSDKQGRTVLLAGIVADADRLLELSRLALGNLPEDSTERQQIVAAAELLAARPRNNVLNANRLQQSQFLLLLFY